MVSTISKKQAKRFLLSKQMLIGSKEKGQNSIERVFDTLRIVQYDPLNPCGRNPDLVLQARISNYHPGDYHKWLYEDKKGIECYDKELCIIPIEDFILTSHSRRNASKSDRVKRFVREHPKEIEELISFIRKHGPICSSEVKNQKEVNAMGWYGTRWGRIALEILWRTGRVVITKRVGSKKYYDLSQKVYSGDYFGLDIKVEQEHILRRLGSVGILPSKGSGGGWQGLGNTTHVAGIIKKLIEKGDLLEVGVTDLKDNYVVLAKDQKLLGSPTEKVYFTNQMRFIAPLDTLIWDRKMTEDLFDFRYRWEVYTPVVKREFGYYVLPILYKDQFVGRIEPVLTKERVLQIKGFWKEKGVTWTKGMDTSLGKAVESFKKYLRAKELIWEPNITC